ncbi:N-acetyltransferase [Halobacteriales archaeon QS_9_68_42]|nr:MAG: N-acetyltransferase [Halobacteriales archaeon QS_1_68_44]PSQ42497.1 MAG: N-acetyltransferase [Halobacteriales archaeon QS_9_68_42]
MAPADEPAVRSLQSHLSYADPELVTAALSGPFLGRVAVADAVVGYAVALPATETALSELVVAPEHRREGRGRRLLEAVAAAAGAEKLVVTTPVDSDAVDFYAAAGFQRKARVKEFYDDGAAALRLVRRE